MTLQQCIANYEANQPTPRHAAAGVVTPRGNATIVAYRLLRQLRELAPEDRLYVTALLNEELVAQPA
jgi:hypothetical protein